MPVMRISREGLRMRTALAMILTSVATLLVFAAGSPAAPDRADLTGRWSCDDGGTYYIRQIGKDVWWTGRSGERKGKKAFANVFHGKITGNMISGSWADDPAGEARNAGKLTLEILGAGKKVELKKRKETGGFSGGTWTPH
jgi:hypothetical protein